MIQLLVGVDIHVEKAGRYGMHAYTLRGHIHVIVTIFPLGCVREWGCMAMHIPRACYAHALCHECTDVIQNGPKFHHAVTGSGQRWLLKVIIFEVSKGEIVRPLCMMSVDGLVHRKIRTFVEEAIIWHTLGKTPFPICGRD